MSDGTGALLAALRTTLTTSAAVSADVGDKVVSDWGVALAPPFIRLAVPTVTDWDKDTYMECLP